MMSSLPLFYSHISGRLLLLLGSSRSGCSLICLHATEGIPVVRERLELGLSGDRVRYGLFRSFNRPLIREHFVNVSGVMRARYDGFVGGGNLTIPQVAPIYVAEEWMGHDIRGVRGRGPQPLRLITIKQRCQQGARLSREVTLHLNGDIDDVIHHLLPVLIVVRRSTA